MRVHLRATVLAVGLVALPQLVDFAHAQEAAAERIELWVDGALVNPVRIYPEQPPASWIRRLKSLIASPPVIDASRPTPFRVLIQRHDGSVWDGTAAASVDIGSDGCMRIDRGGRIQPDARPSCGDPSRPRLYISTLSVRGDRTIAAHYRFVVNGTPRRLEPPLVGTGLVPFRTSPSATFALEARLAPIAWCPRLVPQAVAGVTPVG